MSVARLRVPVLLNAESISEFRQELSRLTEAPDRSVIVLHGDSGAFCQGADLARLDGSGAVADDASAFAECLEALINTAKPVVAEVDGPVLAGGLGIVAAADVVISSDGATFSISELLFGLVPAIVMSVLLRRMSAAKVGLWSLSAETWSADAAKAAGLVDFVATSENLERVTGRWAARLLRADPKAAGSMKRYLATLTARPIGHSVELTRQHFDDPDVIRRVRRFAEEGLAPWITDEELPERA
jgi:enoyl-CoA hydratase/carnithine racemase